MPHWAYIPTDQADELVAQKAAMDSAGQKTKEEAEAAREEAEPQAAMMGKYGFDVQKTTVDQVDTGQEITFEEDRRESNSRAFVVWGEVSWSADIPSGFVFGVAETQDGEQLGLSRLISIRETKAGRKRRIRAVFEDLKNVTVDVVRAVYFEAL